MAGVTRDIPLIARRSTLTRAEARRLLGLPADETIVLASFGGHGLTMDYERIAATNTFTLLITDYEGGQADHRHRLRCFARKELPALGADYPDLVAAADVVVAKPGYGIVSECIANGTALIHASRGLFIEQEVIVAAMPRLLRCQFIEQDDLDRRPLAGLGGRRARTAGSCRHCCRRRRRPGRVGDSAAPVAVSIVLHARGPHPRACRRSPHARGDDSQRLSA